MEREMNEQWDQKINLNKEVLAVWVWGNKQKGDNEGGL